MLFDVVSHQEYTISDHLTNASTQFGPLIKVMTSRLVQYEGIVRLL